MLTKSSSESWSYGQRRKSIQLQEELMIPLDLDTYATAICILVCKNNEFSSFDSANHAARAGTNHAPAVFNRSGMQIFYSDQDIVPDVALYAKQICSETGISAACLVLAAVYCDRAQTTISTYFGETFLLQAITNVAEDPTAFETVANPTRLMNRRRERSAGVQCATTSSRRSTGGIQGHLRIISCMLNHVLQYRTAPSNGICCSQPSAPNPGYLDSIFLGTVFHATRH